MYQCAVISRWKVCLGFRWDLRVYTASSVQISVVPNIGRDSVRIKLGSYNLLLVLLNLFDEINYVGVKFSRKRKRYDQPFNGLIYLFIYHEHGCCFKRSAISLMSVARDACHIKCRTYAVDCLNRSHVRRNEVPHRNLTAFKVHTRFKNTQPLRRSESSISTRFCSNLSVKSRRVV